MPTADPRYLRIYDKGARRAARQIIGHYSTSFTLATRLLSPRVRTDIHNLYAVVRIADEIVDGTAEAAGMAAQDISALLDDYEHAVLTSPQSRFHVDPVLHAFADTARRCEFNPEHLRAFFASMRRDLTEEAHDHQSFDSYVYGSAEVIGLLCVSVFLAGSSPTPQDRQRMDEGARRLGSAFQKINFLRDLHEDVNVLGRAYFPSLAAPVPTEPEKTALVADIRGDLEAARSTFPLLPRTARAGVIAAADLFAELTDIVDATPVEELTQRRISVPRTRKIALAARALARSRKVEA